MSAQRRRVPKYRHYKPKNLGVVRIDGKDHYLGPYDSPQSWERYHRLLAERLAQPERFGIAPLATNDSRYRESR